MAGVFAFSLFACGSKESGDKSGSKSEAKQEMSQSFDDLTMTQQIGMYEMYVDLPSWRMDYGEDFFTAENQNYFIVGMTSDACSSFEELYNDVAKSTLKAMVSRGEYEDFTPDKKEEVTLNNGVKATKFEGTVRMDSYGTLYEYPAYGYYYTFNKQPVMIMSLETTIGGEDLNDEEQRSTTNGYVDQIVETIRKTQ